MRTKLIQVGNSRGVRLPKALIEEAGLGEIVQLHLRGGTIIIAPERRVRVGWAEAAQQVHSAGADALEGVAPTRFERDEWEW